MSGICGVVALDGKTPKRAEVSALLDPLKRRGPDGSRILVEGKAGLGHALLATTPESLIEQLPLRDPGSGCVITADVRLDNRKELFGKLGIEEGGRAIGDGELILRAYLHWGEECSIHLLGDFAFAIWDPRSSKLFCARDHLGMRQLAYCHAPGRRFCFATEPAAVVRHPAVPKVLNEGRIADFLAGMEAFDLSGTYFEGVQRLPPAHWLAIDQSGLQVSRYWRLETPPILRLESHRDYEAAFLEVFTEAVRCRLRSPDPVAAMLSGGMDSGSVVAVAAEILADKGQGPLPTYSVIGPDREKCAETNAILSAAEIRNIDPHFINTADKSHHRAALLELTRNQSDPFDGEMGLLRAVYWVAHRDGIKVMLDGVGGDLVMGPHSHSARLLRRGRILAGLREAWGESAFWGSSWPPWKAAGSALARAFVPRQLRALRRRAIWWLEDRRLIGNSLISPNFEVQSRLRERRRAMRVRDRFFDRIDADERARRIDHAKCSVGRERYDRVASAVAIEARDPFMDLRVIRFALSLPDSQLQHRGWPKILLRRAMAGRMPDGVRWRRGKEHLGGEFTLDLLEGDTSGEISRDTMSQKLSRFMAVERIPIGPTRPLEKRHCAAWVNAICLYYWLESASVRDLRRGGPRVRGRNHEQSEKEPEI